MHLPLQCSSTAFLSAQSKRAELEKEADAVGRQADELSRKLKHTEVEIEETRKEKEQLREEEKLLRYVFAAIPNHHIFRGFYFSITMSQNVLFPTGKRRKAPVLRCSIQSSASLPLPSATPFRSTETESMEQNSTPLSAMAITIAIKVTKHIEA